MIRGQIFASFACSVYPPWRAKAFGVDFSKKLDRGLCGSHRMTRKVEWSPRRLLNAWVPQARDGFAGWMLALSSAELASARVRTRWNSLRALNTGPVPFL